MLVVVLLAAGLFGLLALNTALNEGSFELSRLQKRTTVLTDEQQGLQHQIDQNSAPDALAKRAAELGMVPAGGMAFLDVQNGGKVLGKPGPAQDSPPVKRSTAEPWPMKQQPSPSAQQSAPAPAATAGDAVVQINPGVPAAPAASAAASPAAPAPSRGAGR
ncbi:septum formation initiator family protein [Streptomyces kaniharaensis]|uniref:septum formation initiator family protein n=1 Tax=Streptomyces kaniharaensis TaxID=212423 RepID=UPI002DDC96D2|nr:septum formation initiator family protein [Streptomyces kaniharaensis]